MDIPRKSQKHRKTITRIIICVVFLAVVGAVSIYISKLEPAAPVVDRANIWIDTVKQGSMSRAVRGMGKLVPEEIRLIASTVDGTVERRVLEPGAKITQNTVIIELSNPQLERDVSTAEWDLKAAESGFANFQLGLRRDKLTRAAEMARIESEYEQAQGNHELNLELFKDGLIQEREIRRDRMNVEQLLNRIELEKQQTAIHEESVEAQLFERRIQVDRSRAMYELKKDQLAQLNLTTGVEGILQELSVEVGQRIGIGASVARVVNPNLLKAELSISETQAKDIQVDQSVLVDTRNGIITGVVSRIDPAVKGGSVTIDVRFTEELPAGVRPDLSVDGTIILETLEDVVYMGMPANAQANSQVSLFRISGDDKTAHRVNVQLGSSSVNNVEIQDGLKPGDRVIMSDMSTHQGIDSIRLN